jgi:hypothetical protein
MGAAVEVRGSRAGLPSSPEGQGLHAAIPMSVRVTVKVTREGRYWVGIPNGFPGSCMGRSIMELMQEAQAIMPFMASGPDGTPEPDVVIDYMFH